MSDSRLQSRAIQLIKEVREVKASDACNLNGKYVIKFLYTVASDELLKDLCIYSDSQVRPFMYDTSSIIETAHIVKSMT